jgi:hypothetical protein
MMLRCSLMISSLLAILLFIHMKLGRWLVVSSVWPMIADAKAA